MADKFELISKYKPQGDQPEAIRKLVEGIHGGDFAQTLLGVTGSGKTFTMANVIAEINRPTLVLSHNKTLAAQLYGEFKQFFPNNAVEYFISYYDYYQPEAFIPTSGTFIEKDLSINDEIEKLRLSTTSSLMSGRNDVLVVSSVSCIYGMGNPEEWEKNIIRLRQGDIISRTQLLFRFVDILYNRTDADFQRGTFRVKGDTVDIWPAYADHAYRFFFWGDEVEQIQKFNPYSGERINDESAVAIYPANLFVTGKDLLHQAIMDIQDDLVAQINYFESEGRFEESKRIEERVNFDLEMMRELGYCSGIENYSRYFDKRRPGQRPFCLLDYFPKDWVLMIDESHVTVPQIHAMYGGDRSRKVNLVDYGFRLPAALDNRPLKFEEFETMINQVVFISATPGEYELRQSEGVVVEQIIRPTGLIDPLVDVRPTVDQIDDLLDEIEERVQKDERILVTTLTKRMAEELSKFLQKVGIKTRYIHSEVKTLDRVEILRELRLGVFDVLVGVNLLREGLDLPEVSLVAIMDADKEGFLRDVRSLIQIMGRAARNENGKVIMYADNVTQSMQEAIDETLRRREIQLTYNKEHDITPMTIRKSKEEIMSSTGVADRKAQAKEYQIYEEAPLSAVADPVVAYMTRDQLEKLAAKTKKDMEKAARELDFIEAARLRDELKELQNKIRTM